MPKELTVKLLQPIFDGGQRVETLTIEGEVAPFPVSHTQRGREIDSVGVMHVIASRAHLSLSAVAKLSALDLVTIMLCMFNGPHETHTENKNGKRR